MAWNNQDGLYLKYGTEKTVPTKAGEYVTTGALREWEVKLDLTTLGLTPTPLAVLGDTTLLPAGLRLEEVEVVVETAAVGATATLDIGLVREDRVTVIAETGILAAFPIASLDAAGEKTVVRVGSAGVGTLIGTTLAFPAHITADVDVAAFTAGVIWIRIRGHVTPV